MAYRPILCLDFDGVIHGYDSGWKGAHIIPDKPVAGAADFIEAASEHFEIHILSSRSKSLRGRRAMKRYMKELLGDRLPGDAFHTGDLLYECIKYPWFKPAAVITIDDRALTFTGEWPSLETLKGFKPWNKKCTQ